MNFLPEFVQVLTRDGWVDLSEWMNLQGKAKATPVCLLYQEKLIYQPPTQYSKIYYSGPLLRLETQNSDVIIKGATTILTQRGHVKGKELEAGDHLRRYHMSQIIEKIERVTWEGPMYHLFFGEDVLLPVKYDSDYTLIPL